MKKNLFLLGFLLLLSLSLLLLESSKAPVQKPFAYQMKQAAEKAALLFNAVKEERLARGIEISTQEDPNETGLIGSSYSEITTTLGSLESKRSSTNPNLAAMLVEMLTDLELNPGDRVAVNFSSSFPALNLAVLAALDTLELDGIIINSVGASTYGANFPEFTYLDMEHLLSEKNLLVNHTTYFSMGGQDDIGLEMPEDTRETIRNRLAGYGYEFIEEPDLEENLDCRMAIYTQGGPVKCFINVGGNLLSFGSGSEMNLANGGILTSLTAGEKGNGLIQQFLRQEVPVIHLLNLKNLLSAQNLPYDPIPLPAPGTGDLYQTITYPPFLSYGILLLNAVYLSVMVRIAFPRKRAF